MGIRIREVCSIQIIDIDGVIDINSSDIIEAVGCLINNGKLDIVLNLENVDMVDYSGLSVLAIAYKNAVNHKGRLKLLHVPMPVLELLRIVRLDMVFETHVNEEEVIRSFSEEPADSYHLRRKFTRLDIHLLVRYWAKADQKKKAFEAQALNVSAAGVYLYTPHTLPVHTDLYLELSIPSNPMTIQADGKVAWLADKDLQLHSYPGMGVAFIHLTSEKEKAIVQFIEKNITHRADLN